MNRSSRIIFFGNERLSSSFKPVGAPTLKALLDNGYNVVAVVANYHEATSRAKRKLEVKEFADQNKIPVYLPNKPADILDELKALKPDIGILVAYGRIVPQSVIDMFPKGIVNIHPSLLPLYRGSTPIEQAILDGAKNTGVSLMALAKEMDSGPIFSQQQVKLSGHETKQDLTAKLLKVGGELLIKNLPAILDGSLKPVDQDESKASYCKLLNKEDGILKTTKTASVLEKEVRAYAGWPKSHLEIFGQPVIVTEARVALSSSDGDLVVNCAGSFLEIKHLIAPSGRTMSGADFVRGYKK